MKQSVRSVPRRGKPAKTELLRLLAPSLLGIVACVVCLVAVTTAWFSDSARTSSKMYAATFNAFANITAKDDGGKIYGDEPNYWDLAPGTYVVELHGSGGGKNGGYCKLWLGDAATASYTRRLVDYMWTEDESSEVFTFTLVVVDAPVQLRIEPCWGDYPAAADTFITDGSVLSTSP